MGSFFILDRQLGKAADFGVHFGSHRKVELGKQLYRMFSFWRVVVSCGQLLAHNHCFNLVFGTSYRTVSFLARGCLVL